MNTQRSVLVALVLASLMLAACGAEEEAPAEDPPAAAAEPAAEAEPADEAEPSGGGGASTCERARTCCTAYVDAVAANTPGVSAATACAGVQNANGPGADVGCQAAIDGWRQGLTAMSIAVPAACQ